MPTPALHSGMGRRISVVLLVVVFVPLILLLSGAVAESVESARRGAEQRLGEASESFAERIDTRLAAAESIARSVTQEDAGPGGARLRAAIGRTPAFASVVIGTTGSFLSGVTFGSDPAERVALQAGQSFLLGVPAPGERPGLYVVRGVRIGDSERLAFLELSRDWLWQDATPRPRFPVVVVDGSGTEVFGPAELAPTLLRLFGDHARRFTPGAAPEALGWQAAGREWRGSLAHLELPAAFASHGHWAVVSYAPRSSSLDLPWEAVAGVLGVLVLALGLAFLGADRLARRYVPTLRAIEERLQDLGQRRFSHHPLPGPDELGGITASLALAESALEEEFAARAILGEVDRLLLGPVAIEQVIDAVLPRVQAVAGCGSVGITLLDPDAPTQGRVYATSKRVSAMPVSRVPLDRDMLATLEAAPQGLTVARCETDRHSFLQPQRDLGSEFFWLWPVRADDRLLAVLCVGFDEPPPPAPELAARAGEFASRLALALSNTERDEQLYRQAHFDALTSLPNRLLFRDRLAQELATATAGLSRGALLYVDLDHFKKVNDTVGHAAGDQLLTIVGQRLRACVKEGDTVARLGGDEFSVILRNVPDPDAARTVAERLIEAVQLPVNLAGSDHFVRASIGITLFPDDGVAIDELMRNADLAMYRAKEGGRSRAVFFERRMVAPSPASGDSGLARALRRREFALFYQPQFDLATGRLAGVEALLRWQTPRDGVRQPAEFVPAAEESGLIVDIGAWVLEAACMQLAAWRDRGIAPPRLALNVSVQQLRHAEFPQTLQQTLERFAIPPALIEIELTASVLTDEVSGRAVARLAAAGVRLALCDFGTDYSSLGALRRFPVQTVKIDRAFLEAVGHDVSSATLAETIIVMAHAFGKTVVGEGVETLEELDFLRARNCDLVQGFYLSRPLAANGVTELLEGGALARRDLPQVRAAG